MSILSNLVDFEGWLRDEAAAFDRQADRKDLSVSAQMYAHGVAQAYSQARRRIWQDVFNQPVPEDLINDIVGP
jgi:outer membrane protein TolC